MCFISLNCLDGGGLIKNVLPTDSFLVSGWVNGWYVYHKEGQIQPSKMCLFLSKLTKENEKLRTVILGEPVSES